MKPTETMLQNWSHYILSLLLVIAVIPFPLYGTTIPVHGSLERSSDSLYRPVFIGRINSDCFVDTVLSVVSTSSKVNWRKENILPRYIVWGKGSDSVELICGDTMGGIIADTQRNGYSIINYPSFVNLRGSISFVLLNQDDTEYDMMCFLWGKTDTSSSGHDTSTVFGVFGGRGLDTLSSLSFHTIDTLQDWPFRAMQLRRPKEIQQPGYRDFSGQKSYIIPTVTMVVITDTSTHTDTSAIRRQASGLVPEASGRGSFRIYPNPSVNLTTIVGTQLASGKYDLTLHAASGEVVWRKELDTSGSGDMIFSIDVSTLSTGNYHLSVQTARAFLGTYPIIIIH